MSNEERSAKEIELENKQKAADEYNKTLSGVGVRRRVGQTRGKNPIVIEWDAFDEAQPDTLPKTIAGFLEVTKLDPTKDEGTIVQYLVTGFNEEAYTAASDPLAEYVNLEWPKDAQTQFRLVVRNYSRGANVTLEEAVNLIKPGFEKQFAPAPATA